MTIHNSETLKLREKQAELHEAAKREHEALDKPDLSDGEVKEIEARFDKAMGEYDAIQVKLDRMEKLDGMRGRLESGLTPVPNQDGESRGSEDGKVAEYREVFAKVVCGADVGSLSAEERNVLKKGSTEFRAQNTGTNSAGGFVVPETLSNEIIRSMLMWGPMYDENVATVLNTPSGSTMKMPTVDDTTTTAEAHTEGAALTDDGGKDVTLGQKSLDAYAFDTEFVRWSWELDMDSIVSMEALLASLLGERLGRIANLQLTTGSGSSAPNGVVTASSQGIVAAATNAITFDEIFDFEHSVDPAYRQSPRCRYMFNDSTLLAVRKLKDGQNNYLWQRGDVVGGAPATFNGRNYSINQAMASLSSGVNSRVMLFGDFGKYFVRKVGSPVIGVMRERFWPDLGIAGLIRFDGELGDTAAVKHLALAAS
jgi:HK97 family phage major capsid protein